MIDRISPNSPETNTMAQVGTRSENTNKLAIANKNTDPVLSSEFNKIGFTKFANKIPTTPALIPAIILNMPLCW